MQLKINESNLIANLGQSFTSKQVLFRELAQNSRRAGATKVELTLDKDKQLFIIKDDGQGIKDFQNLFTVAESGWDSEVQAKENPFGMGFFMAVFACNTLKVESCGQELTASKFDILEKREMKVIPGAVNRGTIITLSGIDEDYLNFKEEEFEGFPIPVIVNGKQVENTYSMAVLDKNPQVVRKDFWFGTAYLQVELTDRRYGYGKCFLQGLPVAGYCLRNSNYFIHLKSDEFKARMPDRMSLIDEDDQVKKILQTIRDFECEQIKEKKNDFDWLLENYAWVHSHGLLDLFNAFDKVPVQFLGQAINPLAQFSCNTEESQVTTPFRMKEESKVFTKKDLMSRKILHSLDFWYNDEPQDKEQTDEYAAHLFMYEAKVLSIESECPKNHWLYSMAMDAKNFMSSLKVVVKNEQECNVEQNFCDYTTMMADSFTIETNMGAVEVTHYPCLLWDEKEEIPKLIVPLTGFNGDIINQVCRFRFDDHFDESYYYKVEERFNDWANLEEASRLSEEKMLEVKMKDFLREMPGLAGKNFMISFQEELVQDEQQDWQDEMPEPRKVAKIIVKKQ